MNIIIKILTNFRQKIPSWKVVIVRNLHKTKFLIPRKTNISGHFRLNTPKISENRLCNMLIF
jgi:hypothetical protein